MPIGGAYLETTQPDPFHPLRQRKWRSRPLRQRSRCLRLPRYNISQSTIIPYRTPILVSGTKYIFGWHDEQKSLHLITSLLNTKQSALDMRAVVIYTTHPLQSKARRHSHPDEEDLDSCALNSG